ncbi:MAG: hypothetical protein ACLQVD_05445 [Capsulimonadaceae bacterium]
MMDHRPTLLGIILMTSMLLGCQAQRQHVEAPTATPGPSVSGLPLLPDPRLTPGATLRVTVDDIAVTGYTSRVRDVTEETKLQVYAEYGITHHSRGQYEIDHLVPLELGGSNDITNLWPESYRTRPWNASTKDQLENRLHELVVDGELDLPTAQRAIATDWIAAYRKYFNTDVPIRGDGWLDNRAASAPLGDFHAQKASLPEAAPPADASTASSTVWVNTSTGVYHRPGTRWYGNTRSGQYMTEADAISQGYRAAEDKD